MTFAENNLRAAGTTGINWLFDMPVDSLVMTPNRLAEFTAEMGQRDLSWTPEATLQELFRARKSGRLPRIHH